MIETFSQIYTRALQQVGSQEKLESLISPYRPKINWKQLNDSEILAEITKVIFQASESTRQFVEERWSDIETAFAQFDLVKVVSLSFEDLTHIAKELGLNLSLIKVWSVQDNARFLLDINREYGSVANFISKCCSTDTLVDLWLILKKRVAKLEDNSLAILLQRLGIDSFNLSHHVVAYFKRSGLLKGSCHNKTNLSKIQNTFKLWQQQSGRSWHEISQTVSYSVCGHSKITS